MHATECKCGQEGFLQWLAPPLAPYPRLTAVLEDYVPEGGISERDGDDNGSAFPVLSAAAASRASLVRPKMDSAGSLVRPPHAGSLVRPHAGLMMPPLGKEGLLLEAPATLSELTSAGACGVTFRPFLVQHPTP